MSIPMNHLLEGKAMQKYLLSLALLASLLISGCATAPLPVETNVSIFHQMPPHVGMKFAMIPHKDQEGGLEYKAYAELISNELRKVGMTATTPQDAQVAVFIRYGIDTGREVTSSYPIFGQTGVASSSTYGTASTYGNTSTINATTYNTPSYGVIGSGSRSDTVYRRFLDLEIIEMSSLKANTKIVKLYEGKARSEGILNQLPTIMPPMIQAIFKEFPGQNGRSRKHSVVLPPEPASAK